MRERPGLTLAAALVLVTVFTIACAPGTGAGSPGPRLLSPAAGAQLDNGRTDQQDDIVWTFAWAAFPGADAYQLYVIGPQATCPIVDVVTLGTSYTSTRVGSYIADANARGWTWRVRAQMDDRWGPWSEARTFDVEPPDSDPVLTDWTPAPCPVLLSPAPGAVLDNGRSDGTDDIDWTFEWSACPGASEYWLFVIHRGAPGPAISLVLRETANHHITIGSYIANHNLTDWTWRVRARIGGEWQPWSEEREFEVEPVDTDRP